jgi:hypothetical protein
MSYRFVPAIILSVSVLLLGSCSVLESDEEPETQCILEEIQFDPVNSIRYETISGGRVYRVQRVFTPEEDDVRIADTFLFNYYPDEIIVTDQSNPITPYPYMTVELDEDQEQINRIVRYFASAGVLLFHEFSYPEENMIRIDLTREASTGDVLYIGYALYHLDNDGNISREERFRADDDETSGFRKVQDRAYQYDRLISPQSNLLLPFFGGSNFPDVTFFSQNNVISFTENSQTFDYSYRYNDSDSPVEQLLPSGQTIQFGYINCPDLFDIQ